MRSSGLRAKGRRPRSPGDSGDPAAFGSAPLSAVSSPSCDLRPNGRRRRAGGWSSGLAAASAGALAGGVSSPSGACRPNGPKRRRGAAGGSVALASPAGGAASLRGALSSSPASARPRRRNLPNRPPRPGLASGSAPSSPGTPASGSGGRRRAGSGSSGRSSPSSVPVTGRAKGTRSGPPALPGRAAARSGVSLPGSRPTGGSPRLNVPKGGGVSSSGLASPGSGRRGCPALSASVPAIAGPLAGASGRREGWRDGCSAAPLAGADSSTIPGSMGRPSLAGAPAVAADSSAAMAPRRMMRGAGRDASSVVGGVAAAGDPLACLPVAAPTATPAASATPSTPGRRASTRPALSTARASRLRARSSGLRRRLARPSARRVHSSTTDRLKASIRLMISQAISTETVPQSRSWPSKKR